MKATLKSKKPRNSSRLIRRPEISSPLAGSIGRVHPKVNPNIIRTEERGDLEENVVAHSVGKTLLMRLIRYTLGEPNYASEESQAELAKLLPNGLVVAHWRVDGEDWVVRRPLHDHEPNSAYCVLPPDGPRQ